VSINYQHAHWFSDMADVALKADVESEIARLAAEVSTLRERCGRLVELYDATLDTLSDEASRYDLLRRDRAHAECVKHNDLTQGGSYD